MSSILVTDILQELKGENKRLLNELLYAKQCLKVLIEFKINSLISSTMVKSLCRRAS